MAKRKPNRKTAAQRAKIGDELKTERFVIHMTKRTKQAIFARAKAERLPASQWAELRLYAAAVAP